MRWRNLVIVDATQFHFSMRLSGYQKAQERSTLAGTPSYILIHPLSYSILQLWSNKIIRYIDIAAVACITTKKYDPSRMPDDTFLTRIVFFKCKNWRITTQYVYSIITSVLTLSFVKKAGLSQIATLARNLLFWYVP